jgi:hypothetical protein
MLNWLNLIVLPVFVALISAAIWFRRKTKTRSELRSRMVGVISTVLGLGVWALALQWHLNSTTRVVGFPFTAAVFELHDGSWDDYVGVITLPAMLANLVFWLLLIRIPLMWYRYSRNASQPITGANAN